MLCAPQPPLSPYQPVVPPCDCETCPPDLFASGGISAGTLGPIVADLVGAGPDYPLPCGGFMAEYGPQVDTLITNTTNCTFALAFTVDPPDVTLILEPGVEAHVGQVVGSAGVNLPPVPNLTGADLSQNAIDERGGTAGLCRQVLGVQTLLPPFFALAPGDFIWVSIQQLAYLAGSSGGSLISFILGAGSGFQANGIRL